jgi:acyl phosphate:glycerol-3-phosphate acyltransferase
VQLADLWVVLGAYLLGSVSFSVIVSRLMGLPDPSSYGSGNRGATNVLRSGSKAAAVLTLLGDCLKGVAAVLLAKQFAATELGLAGAVFAVFLGHCYPIFHRFKGGKGVATALGVLLGLKLLLALAVIAVFALIVAICRMVSAGSIAAAIVTPSLAYWLLGDHPVVASLACLGLLLILRHRGNIAKIRAGTENKLGSKA